MNEKKLAFEIGVTIGGLYRIRDLLESDQQIEDDFLVALLNETITYLTESTSFLFQEEENQND